MASPLVYFLRPCTMIQGRRTASRRNYIMTMSKGELTQALTRRFYEAEAAGGELESRRVIDEMRDLVRNNPLPSPTLTATD